MIPVRVPESAVDCVIRHRNRDHGGMDGRGGVGRDRDETGRDRDETGRARNSRPRDGLGRPLPHGSDGVERVPEDLVLPPLQSLAEAQRLIDEGRPFHAHEVLEATWKAAPAEERDLWQGLAQLAVGLTHRARGNATGAARLLHRGASRILPYADDPPHGLNVRALVMAAEELASDLDADREIRLTR